MAVEVIDWGRTGYRDALARQTAWVERRRRGEVADALILTEHEPVFTMGARPGAASHLLWSQEQLTAAGIALEQTNRGGDITYHGPGQVVGYPVVSLAHRRDLHAFLRDLEEVLIRTCRHFGIEADRSAGRTGIWVGNHKVAAIGVAVRGWVTYHGFALNVDPDLSHFAGIIPCGIVDGGVTSMRQLLGAAPLPGQVKAVIACEFREVFAPVLGTDAGAVAKSPATVLGSRS